ncbi:MAG: FAD-dependent oxidoreductase [Methylovulum sp.]|uniref:FAD-dependent oxidoreductase n=1 Tax=Methylovulum sp. TaxID=1916980 RepID=UPI00261F1120|nr:FAD-dependent oxidoreductase [Methylovulum sp.]MDD2724170.1 FAD-dependent oxidoreductase [Methylovulum sp.]MDD5123202.1 FAD-dependent oxidoreductase [Methylovulum sp.]
MRCDVAVIGAGAAGIAAAVAAAEAGANVVLVERYGFTGGLATTALVGTICGLFYRHPSTARYAVQGFAREFADAVQAASQTHAVRFGEGLHFLPYRPAAFHQIAAKRLQQAGVRLFLHSHVSGLQASQRQIHELRIQTQSQILGLHPAAVVDCSGTAQVSLLAGIDKITQENYQAGAFVFQVSGLPRIAPEALSLALIRGLKRGIASGSLESHCDRLSIIPGSIAQGQALLKLGMPVPFDGSIACLSQYELEARERSVSIVDYLSHHEPSLVNLCINAMATEVGIRTSERSQGIAVLDENHVLNCLKPDSGVAVGAWPIEYWGAGRKPELRYFAMDDAYWITAEMLVSRHLDNLFFAGRGLSATEAAIASARVIGTCLSTGYAAGCLAAEFSDTGIWQTAIAKIRRRQIAAHSAVSPYS